MSDILTTSFGLVQGHIQVCWLEDLTYFSAQTKCSTNPIPPDVRSDAPWDGILKEKEHLAKALSVRGYRSGPWKIWGPERPGERGKPRVGRRRRGSARGK